MSSENLYEQITDVIELQTIFQKLIESKRTLLMREEADGKSVFLMKATKMVNRDTLQILVHLFKGKIELAGSSNKILFHFLIEDKKIIGSGHVQNLNGILLLTLDRPVFTVQRREHFRLRLPEDYAAYCVMREQNKTLKFKISDISAGGILIESPEVPGDYVIKQQVQAQLFFPGKDLIKMSLSLRRVASESSKKLGFKFNFSDKESQRDMIGLVMGLYRRFFK